MDIKYILLFSALQLINVMMSTTKSIIQIKGTKLMAAIANSLYYAFYTIVVIFTVSEINIWIKMGVTFVANLIGTYLSMLILDRLRKDKLWKIEVTVPTANSEEIHAQLKSIPHSYIILTNKHTVVTFYCATSKESSMVKQLVNKYDAKYFVSENRITL